MPKAIVSVTQYEEAVLQLMSHIEEILSDEEWEKIDVNLWNNVSLTEPEVKTPDG